MLKFVEIKSSPSHELNNHFGDCSKVEVPYIYIETKTKYSTVYWDYISYHPSIDKVLEKYSGYICNNFDDIARKFCKMHKWKYHISAHLLKIERLDKDEAHKVAEAVYDFIHGFVENHKKGIYPVSDLIFNRV